MRSSPCYKFQCSSCNATYCGKTKRRFRVCVSENMEVSARTGKNIKSTKSSDVRDHMFLITLCLLKTYVFWLIEPMTLK